MIWFHILIKSWHWYSISNWQGVISCQIGRYFRIQIQPAGQWGWNPSCIHLPPSFKIIRYSISTSLKITCSLLSFNNLGHGLGLLGLSSKHWTMFYVADSRSSGRIRESKNGVLEMEEREEKVLIFTDGAVGGRRPPNGGLGVVALKRAQGPAGREAASERAKGGWQQFLVFQTFKRPPAGQSHGDGGLGRHNNHLNSLP